MLEPATRGEHREDTEPGLEPGFVFYGFDFTMWIDMRVDNQERADLVEKAALCARKAMRFSGSFSGVEFIVIKPNRQIYAESDLRIR